ncbi:hypothetical protein JKP88DRAFT_135353, partial [Tribonema minus]
GALRALHTLNVSYNQLTALDASALAELPALRHLDASHNLLTRVEPVGSGGAAARLPRGLETLDLSHNRIARIGGGVAGCARLRVVRLAHNRLRSAGGLESLTALEHLDLGHNAIAGSLSVRILSFNRALRSLVLAGNPFAAGARYRPSVICTLPHLVTIDHKALPQQ